jgi:PmbA protein
MSENRFSYTLDELRGIASDAIEQARRLGASFSECDVSEGHGLSVTVRKGKVDTLEHHRDKGLSISVCLGERPKVRRGNASTSDFSSAAIASAVEAAHAIARHTAEDDCAGPPDAELLATRFPDLDLYHPWPIEVEQAVELTRRCEAAAFALSPMIRNSEGASLSTQQSQFVLGNSLGFLAGYPSTRHSLGVSVIASKGRLMQRDDWYSGDRVPSRIAGPEALGRYAGERALARLGARKLSTRECPVLFEAPVASQLIGSFIGAISGPSLYRKASFLLDTLDKPVFSPLVTIDELAYQPRALGSSSFDDEGVVTRDRELVSAGVLGGYLLGSYSARKLGMKSTGNAGGHHNLVVRRADGKPGPDFVGMLRELGTGLLVTEMLGHGTNMVTGDYSRGAAGYWVENGAIQYPVEEITIAGNLRDMYKGIGGIGGDTLVRGARSCGSILIDRMTVAGE